MREEQIFHQALEQAADQRAAFLDAACGSDVDLRERVAVLLRAQENPGSFLQSPAPGVDNSPTVDLLAERPGTQIGPYKVLQPIGEGGMGVVYMAEQHEPVKRRVALKIIKPGMDSRQVIARFEAERQALSLMDHPNIAKVLDAGTTDSGRPYFVMELVKGQPITQYCDEKHLTPRQRLELLLPVCQAIQHAHQKGIIHRDIKPTNILVAEYDQQPVPKVIDFGVAKATSQTLTEKTMFTGLGQIVGTLEYMSPEQAKVNQLDIDTRSDIYSLGVLLYELLTGSTPFDRKRLRSAAIDEMLRIIREEEPPKPSTRLSDLSSPMSSAHSVSGHASTRSVPLTLASIAAQRQTEPAKLTRLVRGELDWIVMKALEKDRSRRYETASGLAADLQHYLNDEPVVACPPSAGYRFQKFARRNRTALVTVSLVSAALIVGTAISVWQAVRATHAKGLAKAETERANRESNRANDEAQKAKTEAATAEAVNDYLIKDLLAQASPRNEPDRDIKLRTVVDRAAATIEGRFPDQPLVEAKIHTVVARTFLTLREMKKAEKHFRRAFEIRRQFLGSEHALTGESQDALGLAILIAGRPAEAEPILVEAARTLTLTNGPSHDETLNCLSFLAEAMQRQGRHVEADTLLQKVYETRKKVSGAATIGTLNDLRRIAFRKAQQGQHEEAEKLFREVMVGLRRELKPDHPELLFLISSLAQSVLAQGRCAEAEKLFREVLDVQRRVLGAAHPRTLDSMRGLIRAITAQGRHADAIPLLGDAIQDVAKLVADEPTDVSHCEILAEYFTQLGELQFQQKRFAEAEKSYVGALAQWERLSREVPTDANFREKISSVHQGLGRALSAMGEKEAAVQALRQSVALREKLASDFPNDVRYPVALGHTYLFLAWTLNPETKTAEREQLFQQAAAQFEKVQKNESAAAERPFMIANLANTRRELAQELVTQKRMEEAEAAYRQAVELLASVTAEPYTATNRTDTRGLRKSARLCHSMLIDFLTMSSRHEEAHQVCQQAIRFYERLAAERPDEAYFRDELANRQSELANLLIVQKKFDEAEQAYRQAIIVLEKLASDFPARADYRQRLGNTYQWSLSQVDYVAGRPPNADSIRKALAIWKKLADDFPEMETNWANLGVAHLRMGNSGEGIACLTKAIEMNPDDSMPWHQRGIAFSTLGQWEKAVGDLTKAAELNPKLWWHWYQRGEANSSLRHWGEANADYARAIALGASNADTWLSKGTAEVNLGDWDHALADYGIAVGIDPSTADSMFETLRAAGKLSEAEKLVRQALAVFEKQSADSPTDPKHRQGIANLRSRLGQVLRTTRPEEAEKAYRQAIAIYEKLVTESPGGRVVVEGLGHSYRLLADVVDRTTKADEREQLWILAAKQFEELLAKATPDPRREFHRFFLADTYRSLADDLAAEKRTAEAETYYRKALDQFALLKAEVLTSRVPDFAWHRDELNRCFANLTNLLTTAGRTQEVKQVCQEAIALYTRLVEECPDELYFREGLEKRQAELKKLMESNND